MELIAAASKVPENAQHMRTNKITEEIAEIFKFLLNSRYHSQYISFL